MTKDDDILLKRIANHLIINASFLNNIGLYHGKMGVVLFFAHYARYTGKSLYDDFAGELLEEIYEDLYIGLTVDFENGLCGIGWGVEYLVQNNYMEGNTADILKEIDFVIQEKTPDRMRNLSFRKGLAGVGYYVLYHISNIGLNTTVFDDRYMKNLLSAINSSTFQKEDEIPDDFIKWCSNPFENKVEIVTFPSFFCIDIDCENIDWENIPLGIENGLSGLGFKLMGFR